ncbi:restriction endonuclease subunit S [Pseudoalteromonas sp. 1_2015MBL_MicDiv]|uniref:restriction endonuclease subunit S n=1 Tax=Pseudoalteromonas sp. 1_2015MBL_MicDiv TaxID=1720343 RepID=UPI000BBF1B04|nr:restriction endonuclease subunit S [Pseudoalteromonas sp. 1_2015MBL_MicDiv]ATG78159.1 restriction endonuclease subunit S [Pseudoalteromonas sp. 1_2015MBL_MicDiv]
MSELKAGKYQTYPEYKDSNIDWLDAIPEHWTTSKLRYTFSFGKGLTITKENLRDTGIPCVNYGEVHSKYGFEVNPQKHPLKCVDEEYLKTSPYALLENGDIVFADTSEDIDGSGNFTQLVSDEQIFAGYHTIIARPFDRECSRFYAYLLDSKELRTQIRHAVKGVKVFSITQAILRGVNIWLPPIGERTQIANFLDHEIAKIDTLIEKQQQLIKLLKEKRQAVISHVVTKGLDPQAPTKDSGVEWLGEIPEHWVVSKFGYISQVVRGGSPRPAGDPTLFNGDYSPWVTVAEITKDDEIYLTETETFLTRKGSGQCRVFSSGTLLLSNSGATLGVPAILKIDANANDGVVGFESLNVDTEFAYFYLSTLTEDLRERVKQGSGQPNLNTDIVKDISIPIPPKGEVRQIVSSIHKLRNDYSKLIIKATSAIKLMKERRTALISAAVTGKIDVRNWEQPND